MSGEGMKRNDLDGLLKLGEDVLDILRKARDRMEDARVTGAFFRFGGLINASDKQKNIEKAKAYLEEAAPKLEQFRREVEEFDFFEELDLEMGDFYYFADFLLSGFLVNQMLLEQIEEGIAKLDEAIGKVQEVLEKLKT